MIIMQSTFRERPHRLAGRRPEARYVAVASGRSPDLQLPLTRRAVLQGVGGIGCGLAAAGLASAEVPDLASTVQTMEQGISYFQLSNGMKFVVLERHVAPIVSCHLYADVGAFQEVAGQTGLAHLLEHMAFKGTPQIGSRDWQREQPVLASLNECFYDLRQAREAGDMQRAGALKDRFEQLQRQADELAVPNALPALLEQQGAVGLNASTSQDATNYFLSLPSNKLELWFALESDRFQNPVLRELYSEKKVVLEERRLRVDNSPAGKFQEQFQLAALANNYRRPTIGFADDIERLGAREVSAFFEQHYSPCNLTAAIVGDVDAQQVQRWAEKYWGGWEKAAAGGCEPAVPDGVVSGGGIVQLDRGGVPLPEATSRPEAQLSLAGTNGSLNAGLVVPSRAGPLAMMAWYRQSDAVQPESSVYPCIAALLSGGRVSLLQTKLVQQGRALSAQCLQSYPGTKYDHAVLLYAVPGPGGSAEGVAKEVKACVQEFAEEGPREKALDRIKRSSAYQVLSGMQSNSGMAALLAEYEAVRGGWQSIGRDLQTLQDITSAQVQDVSLRLFQDSNCFTGLSPKLGA